MGMARRVYSREFKLHLLKEVQSGKTQAEVARKYQILPKMISRWACEYEIYAEEAFGGLGNDFKGSARRAELERKIARLETENQLLKKALSRLDQSRASNTRNGELE